MIPLSVGISVKHKGRTMLMAVFYRLELQKTIFNILKIQDAYIYIELL